MNLKINIFVQTIISMLIFKYFFQFIYNNCIVLPIRSIWMWLFTLIFSVYALFVCAEPSTRFLNLCVAQQESQLLPARAHPVLSTSCGVAIRALTLSPAHALWMALPLVRSLARPYPLSLTLTLSLALSECGNAWVSALLLLWPSRRHRSKTECTLNMNANELSNKTWKLQNFETFIKVRPREEAIIEVESWAIQWGAAILIARPA